MCSYMHGMCNMGRTGVPKSVPNFTDTDFMICILVYTSHISFMPRQFHSSLLLTASVSLAMLRITSSGTDTCTVSAHSAALAVYIIQIVCSTTSHRQIACSTTKSEECYKSSPFYWSTGCGVFPNKVWLMSQFVKRSPAASMGYRRMQPPHPITAPAGVSMDMHGFTCPGQ